MKLTTQTIKIRECPQNIRKQCFEIICTLFAGVSYETFLQDFSEKDSVILVMNNAAVLGFSTLMTYELPVGQETIQIIFSGDTAILPKARKNLGVGRELLAYLERQRTHKSYLKTYYVLISKGWRTYRVMTQFFTVLWPSQDTVTSDWHASIARAFAQQKYPNRYDENRNIIVPEPNGQRVTCETDVMPQKTPCRAARFFLKQNPNYLTGEELVCVAQVSPENYRKAAQAFLAMSIQKHEHHTGT